MSSSVLVYWWRPSYGLRSGMNFWVSRVRIPKVDNLKRPDYHYALIHDDDDNVDMVEIEIEVEVEVDPDDVDDDDFHLELGMMSS